MSDDENEECEGLQAVGFMFDAHAEKDKKNFRFETQQPEQTEAPREHYSVEVTLTLIDSDPGAVQSGHYLWPASGLLAQYLVDSWDTLPHGNVLELGAGCGLAGLVAACLPGCGRCVLTDHDPGVVATLTESIKEQQNSGVAVHASELSACPLAWGEGGNGDQDEDQGPEGRFPLIIGSDVVYAQSVVGPLFATVGKALARRKRGLSSSSAGAQSGSERADATAGRTLEEEEEEEEGGESCAQKASVFVMSQSFAYSKAIEDEIAVQAAEHRLQEQVVYDTLHTAQQHGVAAAAAGRGGGGGGKLRLFFDRVT